VRERCEKRVIRRENGVGSYSVGLAKRFWDGVGMPGRPRVATGCNRKVCLLRAESRSGAESGAESGDTRLVVDVLREFWSILAWQNWTTTLDGKRGRIGPVFGGQHGAKPTGRTWPQPCSGRRSTNSNHLDPTAREDFTRHALTVAGRASSFEVSTLGTNDLCDF